MTTKIKAPKVPKPPKAKSIKKHTVFDAISTNLVAVSVAEGAVDLVLTQYGKSVSLTCGTWYSAGERAEEIKKARTVIEYLEIYIKGIQDLKEE